jgi:hypothetical protein
MPVTALPSPLPPAATTLPVASVTLVMQARERGRDCGDNLKVGTWGTVRRSFRYCQRRGASLASIIINSGEPLGPHFFPLPSPPLHHQLHQHNTRWISAFAYLDVRRLRASSMFSAPNACGSYVCCRRQCQPKLGSPVAAAPYL